MKIILFLVRDQIFFSLYVAGSTLSTENIFKFRVSYGKRLFSPKRAFYYCCIFKPIMGPYTFITFAFAMVFLFLQKLSLALFS